MRNVWKFLKIAILSFAFALLINISSWYFFENEKTEWILFHSAKEMVQLNHFSNISTDNKHNFTQSNKELIAPIWVALAINIGLKHTYDENQKLYRSIPYLVQNIWNNWKVNNNSSTFTSWHLNQWAPNSPSLSKYMNDIQVYSNILNVDIKSFVSQSKNKSDVLSAYDNQLKIQYASAKQSISHLKKKKTIFSKELSDIEKKINISKEQMSKDFNSFNQAETQKNINIFLHLKAQQTALKTQMVFMDQYIKQFEFLNTKTQKIITHLEINKFNIINNIKSEKNQIQLPQMWKKQPPQTQGYKNKKSNNRLIQLMQRNLWGAYPH